MAKISDLQKLMTVANDRAHLHAWIQRYTGLDFPSQTVSRFSNSNPFEFIWLAYRAIIDGKSKSFMALAGRDGMKCSLVGTRVITQRGLITIETARVGDQVWDGTEFRTVLETFDEGEQDGVEVVTGNGLRLVGSIKHRVQVLTGTGIGWKKMIHITPDDYVVTSTPVNLAQYHFDRVKRVTEQRGYFWDLEVETSHAYWSNGFVSHNTLSLSIIDLLAMLHDGRQLVHIAMTSQQASRARNYLDGFINKQPLIKAAVVKQNTKEIKLLVDGEQVGMELIPATPKAVQGAHGSVLSFDEVASSMEPNNVRAYKDAHGILGSSAKHKPAVIIKITSRQAGHSLAELELRDAAKSGLQVLKWTTLDACERCPDERSGTIPTPLWIHPLRGDKYTDIEFKSIAEGRKDGFVRTTATMENCRLCPIASFCAGDLKHVTSKSLLLRTIDDVIQKIRLAGSWDWAVAQIMSMKPSSEGNVYFEFDRTVHQPGWDKMFEALTGSAPGFPMTRDRFIQEMKDKGCQFYAAVDWGWSSPSTCVVLGVDAREMIYVVEAIGRTYTPDPEFIEILRTSIHLKYNIQMYAPDIANGSGNALLRQAGLPTTDKIDKSINLGVNIVKGLLRVPGTNGQTRILFAPDLDSTIAGIPGIMEEFEIYHKKTDQTGKILDNDEPEDEHNHYLDALRYISYWLFGKMRMKVGSDFDKVTKTKEATNIPSLDEIARQHGLSFVDNREGPPPDAPEEKPGGALWSWT